MSTLAQLILRDAQEAHAACIDGSNATALQRAFLTWLLSKRYPSFNLDSEIALACQKRGGARSYRDVALFGFCRERVEALALGKERTELVTWLTGTKVSTKDGLDPIVGDPIGILGVREAIRCTAGPLRATADSWLMSACSGVVSGDEQDLVGSLYKAIESTGGATVEFTSLAPEVVVALQSKGVLTIDPKFYTSAFNAAKYAPQDEGLFSAAIRLAALDWIASQVTLSLSVPDANQVIQLLQQIPASLYRWVWENKPRTRGGTARMWHIDNEYHFQSLLYAILRPVFPDLKEEEYTASVGTTQPRTDLYIPSLKLVVEVKFWYQSDKSQKLINELAADASLYRAKGSDVQTVVPVIWDDGARTQEHPTIQTGIRAIDGLREAIFVNRPSTWK